MPSDAAFVSTSKITCRRKLHRKPKCFLPPSVNLSSSAVWIVSHLTRAVSLTPFSRVLSVFRRDFVVLSLLDSFKPLLPAIHRIFKIFDFSQS
jgi:hypothetical protein